MQDIYKKSYCPSCNDQTIKSNDKCNICDTNDYLLKYKNIIHPNEFLKLYISDNYSSIKTIDRSLTFIDLLDNMKQPTEIEPTFNLLELSYDFVRFKNDFVRVDTIGDGSCLLHSIFLGLSPIYRRLTVDNKKDFVRLYRFLLNKNTVITFNLEEKHELNDTGFLNDSIIFKILDYLKINLIIFENEFSSQPPDEIIIYSEYNKIGRPFLIFNSTIVGGQHSELIIRKNNINYYLYTEEELTPLMKGKELFNFNINKAGLEKLKIHANDKKNAAGGYYQKYLKYKAKYLQLKHQNN
jgi:hypothetical protein